MLIFTVLQQQALFFPKKLCRSYARRHTFGGFFCFPLVMTDSVLEDAQLIQQTAICLDFYPDVEKKLSILTGMYVYVWQRYESSLHQVMNKPFLEMLAEHLEIKSLSLMDKAMYQSSLDNLNYFCSWVYQNQQFTELRAFYLSLPANMRATIHIQRNEQPANDGCGFTCKFMDKISINGLF